MHTLLTWMTSLAPSSDSPGVHLSGCPAPLFHRRPAGLLFLIPPWPGEPGPAGEGYGTTNPHQFRLDSGSCSPRGLSWRCARPAPGLVGAVRCGAAVCAAGLASNC